MKTRRQPAFGECLPVFGGGARAVFRLRPQPDGMMEAFCEGFDLNHSFGRHDEQPAWEKSIGLETRLDFLSKFLGLTTFVCRQTGQDFVSLIPKSLFLFCAFHSW